MAGLGALEAFGIKVDFPDEPTTGGDMEWVFVSPREVKGGRYLRLILQAKRAKASKAKNVYWYYEHLDYEDGQQAKRLVASGMTPGSLALYIFYHPLNALDPPSGSLPAIEGINLVFADRVASVVSSGCGRKQKKVSFWRDDFMSLSELLCWPLRFHALARDRIERFGFTFFSDTDLFDTDNLTVGFHPDAVARRLNGYAKDPKVEGSEVRALPVDGIPDDIRRRLAAPITTEDRKRLKRPRAIFTTSVTKESPFFDLITRRAAE